MNYEHQAKEFAHAVRGLSEALAFHQRTRSATAEERAAVGGDDICWLRDKCCELVELAAEFGYPVRGPIR